MTDYYTIIAAITLIECSKKDYREFSRVLARELEEQSIELGLQAQFLEEEEQKGLFIYSTIYFSLYELEENEKVRKAIGKLLERTGDEYIEFGFANIASAMLPRGFDGGRFRIYKDGEIGFPKLKW